LSDADLSETIAEMRHQVVDDLVAASIPEKSYVEQWDIETLKQAMRDIFALDLPLADWAAEEGIGETEIHERLIKAADERFAKKAADFGPQIMRQIERAILLQTLDGLWREHLVTIEHLRQVIGLRGYGQRDPLNEYKNESFTMFEHMLARLREAVTGQLMHVELAKPEEVPPLEQAELPPMEAHHMDATTGEDEFALEPANGGNGRGAAAKPARARKAASAAGAAATANPADPSTWGKVQRNALCPCGSGKKYKHCHGAFS
jgi:preprotein translocase subunit SecA